MNEWIWDETLSRRRLLKAGVAAGAGLSAASFLAACSDTTVPGGQSPNKAPGGLPLARPDNPVTLPIYPDNEAIPSGLEVEDGPLKLYNWAEYINPPVIKSFEKRYGVDVELSTFSTIDEAVAKLASGAVGFDVFVPTQPFISMLVSGRILQPLNLSYIPNLHKNVWPSLVDPWYDRGSRYTVPYTIYTTGIALAQRLPARLRPLEARATPTRASGRRPTSPAGSGMLDDQREGLAMGLLRNGITDVNTEDEKQLEGASDALRELTDNVNLRFYTNEYQHLADGSMWLHQAWSGDIAAIGYYMPKGTSAERRQLLVARRRPRPDRQRHLRRPQGRPAPGPRPPLPRPHARPRRSASSTSNTSATSSR